MPAGTLPKSLTSAQSSFTGASIVPELVISTGPLLSISSLRENVVALRLAYCGNCTARLSSIAQQLSFRYVSVPANRALYFGSNVS